jgi:7-keto-8-aminopelargonate synthetase-like enzyme
VVRVVTLSKALGAGGGAVCGDALVRRLLMQRGRALIFSTALPHPTVAAARAGLRVLREEGPALLSRLRANARLLRGTLLVGGDEEMPIVPVLTGDPQRAVALEEAMLEAGYLVQAVRPPTVPEGTSRVRMVVSAAHSEEELRGAAGALRAAVEKV